MRALLLTIVVLVSFAGMSYATDECQSHVFTRGGTQLEPNLVTVRDVRGYVDDGNGARINDVVCVRLFKEKTKAFVTSVHTDHDGRYSLSTLREGDYRLVVTYTSFCPISFGVHVRKHAEQKNVVVHLLPRGIDSCSWSELK